MHDPVHGGQPAAVPGPGGGMVRASRCARRQHTPAYARYVEETSSRGHREVPLYNFTAGWEKVRDSLWFLPSVLTLGAVVLAAVTVELDRHYIADDVLPYWLYSSGAAGARGVLSSISTSLITVTGVVFSVTIVALQLASTQFTPRILRNFTSDRANQLVLGVFIGTFTYALLVQRVVRSSVEDTAAFVPSLSVTVAVALSLVSIGFLIFFIDHLAESIEAGTIVDRVSDQTIGVIERLFPERAETGGADAPGGEPRGKNGEEKYLLPGAEGARVEAAKSGYLNYIDEDGLLDLAEREGLVLRVDVPIGEFVIVGQPLVSLWPAVSRNEELAGALRRRFILGSERTPAQDIERGLVELADIAVKALSPGINDPTTAAVCIDRLSDVLVAIGTRRPPDPVRRDDDGSVRLVARRYTFEEAVCAAFDPIRPYAASHVRVVQHLLDRIAKMAPLLPPDRLPPLEEQVGMVTRLCRLEIASREERAPVEEASEVALAVTRRGKPAAGRSRERGLRPRRGGTAD